MEKSLPNLIVAGVPKAGTTSLHAYLSKHPQIFSPEIKEIYYFSALKENKPLKDIAEYKKHFLHRNTEKYAIDATPNYFSGGKIIISKMKDILPEHKVIVILRNPVNRFISSYNFLYSKGWIPDKNLMSFLNKCIKSEKGEKFNLKYYGRAIAEGKYINFLPEWIKEYGPNFKLLYFEDFISNPQSTMQEIAEWLSIDVSPFNEVIYSQENKTVFVKSRGLHSIAYPIVSTIKKSKALKTFLRRNVRLKSLLKKSYYKFNREDVQKQPVQKDYIELLNDIYMESNEKLFKYLVEMEIKLPNWKEAGKM